MAFLRSICAHRTTNLIYSRASNVRYDTSSSPTSTSSSSSSSSSAASSASTLKNCNWPSSVNLSRQVATSSVNNNNGSSENSGSESNDQISNLKKRQLNQQQNNGLLVQSQQSKPQQQQTRLFNNQRQSQDITSRSNFNTIKTSESILSETRSTKSTSSTSCKKRDAIDTSFNDPEAAFKSKTTWELTRAYIVYLMCSSEKLVEHNLQIMKVMRTLMGTKLFSLLMKATFYGHFVAGEDQIKIVPILERLRSFGVKPILDYSVEEDISQEEAEKREVASSVSSAAPDETDCDSLPQYHVDKSFADRRYKVSSARTYFYLNEATCERNMDIFIKCLEAVSEHDAKFPPLTKPEGATFGTGFTAIKLTALGRPQLLLQLSEVIMRTRKYMEDLVGGHGNVLSHHKTIQDLEKYYDSLGDNKDVKTFLKNVTSDKEGILHLFPWSGIVDENSQLSETFRVPDPKTGQMRRLISQIPPNEEEMFRNMIRRVNTIAKVAQELDVRFMIDAEQTYFQPAISRITLELMRKYNTERAYVFNTYQCYLKDAYQEVVTDLEQAKRQNFFFGAKLVRGAYMDQERARATALGYPDPVNPTYEATTASYNKTLEECLRRIKILKDSNDCTNKIGIMVASHNEDTVRFGLEKMKEYGIEPEDKVVCFGQLLGMCDYITFPLGQGGYSVYKYIPYGPVHEVLPYLSRRATENKGVLKKIKKEKRLLLNELRNRVLSGKIFYKPKGEYVPL